MPPSTIPVALLSEHFWTLSKSKARKGHIVVLYIQRFGESVLDLKHRNPIQRLPASVVAFILKRLFHALDLLHNECRIAHTDIKEAKILLGADDSVLQDFECEQLRNPCPRKQLSEGTVYRSRELNMPRAIGEPMLCDFGSAVPLYNGVEHHCR